MRASIMCFAAVLACAACSPGAPPSGASGGGTGEGGSGVGGGGGYGGAAATGGGGDEGISTTQTTTTGGTGGACSEVAAEAKNEIQPSDIILAIDQSGSMDEETAWVKQQISGFAQQITSSGIDVHVVVIAGPPGSENGFCVPAPLGSGACPDDDKLPTFLHVDQHVESHDALAQIVARYPDYAAVLRPFASKHIIVISDDESDVGASAFDSQIKAKDPPMFEGYVFHAIASSEDDPGDFECVLDPSPCCGYAEEEGKVYKQLVQMTGGVFGDLCLQDFKPVWDQVSKQVVASSKLSCEWDIPPAPEGETFDPTKVNVEFSADGVPSQSIGQVPSAADCAQYSGGWYYDDPANPTKVLVCPETCQSIQSATNAKLAIKFGCASVPATPK